MCEQTITRHAETRMRQRGLREMDVDLLVRSGTLIGDDTYFLTSEDASREIARRKREIQQIERLRNVKVVVCGDAVVTAYHASPKTRRSVLRKGRETR